VPDLYPPLEGETLMAYLVRTRPQYEWTDSDGEAEPYAEVTSLVNGINIGYRLRPRLTSAEWDAYVVTIYPPDPPVVPPPARLDPFQTYTYSEPYALSDQLQIDGPCIAVLVDITTPPTKTGRYNVGGQVYDYGVGMISFSGQDEYVEPWQYLGFRKALFLPKTMTIAFHTYFRVLAGAEGTATLVYLPISS